MEDRLQRLAQQLPDDVDAMLICEAVNRQYFTGLRSSAGTLLVFKQAPAVFLIDSRYYERAKKDIHGCEVVLQGKLFEQVSEWFQRHGVRTAAVEGDYLNLSQYARFKEGLPKVSLVSKPEIDSAIRRMRMIKSPEEIASVRAAQKITDDAFSHIYGYIKEGRTEREIAGELLDFCYRHGSERPSFDYIVVSGKNSSMPHGVPGEKPVERGDFITMDFGCMIDGYCSDMTRTVAVGALSDEQHRVYQTVLDAQLAGIAAVRAGVSCKTVDAAARNLITVAGYGEAFGHGTGHSLGIEIHEPPAFSKSDETICEAGMVLSVEPGIYLEGKFGVRIEDLVHITADGCENLTASEKKLLVLP